MLENLLENRKDRLLVQLLQQIICYKSENKEIVEEHMKREKRKNEIMRMKNTRVESFVNCYSSYLRNKNHFFYFQNR